MFWQSAVLVIPTMKTVSKIDVRLWMQDASGAVNMTDVMFQGGLLATIWSGHTSEIRFSFEQ